jgi:hypothetical protein
LVAQVFEVTVTSTIQVTVDGVLLTVKSVSFEVVVCVAVKKAVVLLSGLAFTSMVTPEGGIVELTVTRTVKGPAEGASVDPLAGVVVTDSVVWEVHGSAGFLLQKGVKTKTIATAKRIRCNRIMDYLFDQTLN